MKKLWVVLLVVIMVAGFVGASDAAVIGNWSGSSRSWNNADMSILRAALIAAGHTIRPDAAISSAELAADNIFVIGEAASTPNSTEMAALSAFVNGGGILLVLTDSGASGVAGANAIFAAIGSALLFSGTSPSASPFPADIFTNGPPFNIVGQTLTTSPGNEISGGTTLAGSFIHYQQIGAGYVFGFGDRSDHNFAVPDSTTANGRLFLNIAAAAGQAQVPASEIVPTLTEWGMIMSVVLMGFLSIYYLRRKRFDLNNA